MRASCEPFSDEMLIDEDKLMNWLDRFGVDYDTDPNSKTRIFKRNHVSGHASREELEELVHKLQPRVLYPVHTERPVDFTHISPKGTTVVHDIIAGKSYLV